MWQRLKNLHSAVRIDEFTEQETSKTYKTLELQTFLINKWMS